MSGGKVGMTINSYINIGGGSVSNILIYIYDGMEHSGGVFVFILLSHYRGVIT